MTYLVILFAAAFLLMLFSYLMQQRQNSENISDLSKSVSAVQSLEELIKEKDELEVRVNGLEADVIQLQQQLDQAQTALDRKEEELSSSLLAQEALQNLNQLRALYNQRHYEEARTLLASWEGKGLEDQLKAVSDGMTQAQREIYDPHEAYLTIVEKIS